jgi:glyoxylase-like metal-dependent hydrolase (beta-lactamase superfamily II)
MKNSGTVEFPDFLPARDGVLRESRHAPGVLMLDLPLPFGPKQVNAWLLEDGDGWTVIDCGPDTPEVRQLWSEVLSRSIGNGKVKRIVGTHGHVDHIGQAGPLWHATARPAFHMTRTEWLGAGLRAARAARPGQAHDGDRLFRSLGVPESELRSFTELPRALSLLAPLPDEYRRIVDGDMLRIGERDWRVMTAGGHAPEHALFHCEDEALLIAGDQVLPRITPFVGVFPDEPMANPLGEFLSALDRLSALPADTLVLPAHGPAFRGLHARLAELRHHHEMRLAQIAGLAERPVTAYRIAADIFARAIVTEHRRLALAETLAHLNLLCATGRLVRGPTADGATTFEAL